MTRTIIKVHDFSGTITALEDYGYSYSFAQRAVAFALTDADRKWTNVFGDLTVEYLGDNKYRVTQDDPPNDTR